MKIRLTQVKLPLDYEKTSMRIHAAQVLNVSFREVLSAKIRKKSVDARDKSRLGFVFTIDVVTSIDISPLPRNAAIIEDEAPRMPIAPRKLLKRPLVVGLGPAGLFAALTLARLGLNPIVIERGKPVDERAKDVEEFWRTGVLNTSSNVQFGEGGAGAFSDGKLTTGIKDVRLTEALKILHEAGAPEDILYSAKPHIGTDNLRVVVANIRNEIIALGGTVMYETALIDIEVSGGTVVGAKTTSGDIDTRDIILAIGHSSRDTLESLKVLGVKMSKKPFSIGARIEHSQKMIDISQYGKFAGHKALGAADYKLVERMPDGRGVYTFCMCPGGYVVSAASENGGVVTNGMSYHSRSGANANSAVLVSVEPSDFGSDDPLSGVYFQRKWESLAYDMGGCDFKAPAQLVVDFIKNQPSSSCGSVMPTYKPGVKWTNLDKCLPAFAANAMRRALPIFDRRIKGFAGNDAVLTGVETRSSSPVRIDRNELFESVTLSGLYPCGEGAGYAGGILSSAVDGMRCAEALAEKRDGGQHD